LTITKPYVIVEGIDFLNNQDFSSHIWLYNNSLPKDSALIYNLYQRGYDVIILDFDEATDYIQNNAMLLVKLIEELYSSPSLNDDNLVVMGYSMGGLVARYALTWMEANNINHHTQLYVSDDSPHKGANFPLGLQELVEDIKGSSTLAWLAGDILHLSFKYNFNAARQMLIYHYFSSLDGIAKPHPDKINFFNEMYNMNPSENGYPSKPLKIAISNGNYNGIEQDGFTTGDEILHFDYWKPSTMYIEECWIWNLIGIGKCKRYYFASDHITATVRAGFDNSHL